MNMRTAAFVFLVVATLGSLASAQVIDSPELAKQNQDFLVQGEYAGSNKAMQVIALGDGEFELVVYELGLPGAGWNGTPVQRVDGDADTVAQLIESLGMKKVERTSPTLGAAPPSNAVILFDGSEESLNKHWKAGAKRTEDGLLIQGATTKQTFRDYQLHVEFRTPFMPKATGQARGNSGIYHQGRYETQVLDSFGLEGKNNEAGGIYTVRDPDTNMCLPPLSWQTYDVEFTAARFDDSGKKNAPARMTVRLNGVLVHAEATVPGATRAAPLSESPEPGPIYLQDHGNPVRFRNVWIVERDLEQEARRPIVAGFERFFAASDPDQLGGRQLIETLGCQGCHRSSHQAEIAKTGPILDGIAARARKDHLLEFIANPHAIKTGTTMPDPWHGLSESERRRSATAIVNYLTAGTNEPMDQISDASAVQRGETVYHERGCTACHSPLNQATAQTGSVPLGEIAKKYTLASLTKFLVDPTAVRPCGRMPKVVANNAEARDVASYLLRDVVVLPGTQMIRRRIYPGKQEQLPDVSKLQASTEDMVDHWAINDIEGNFTASYDSYLQINESGRYTFYLACDDGGRLIVNGKTVIDHDGIHPATEKRKQINLKVGVYPLQVLYFEGGGQRELTLEVESESMGRSALTTMLVASQEGAVKSLLPSTFKPDASLVAEGQALFVKAGCIQCHQRSDIASEQTQFPPAKPLSACRQNEGCLAADPQPGLPQYELTAIQRERIAAALKVIDQPFKDARQAIHATMASLNCYACHARDGVGGPESTRNAYFATTTPEMGDEGRLPPNLSGVGDKLNDEYLKSTLRQGADERPYMKTRMPGFGDAVSEAFVQSLVALDRKEEGHNGQAIKTPMADLLAEGRTLCGNDGLACIKCHTFGGVGLAGIQAIDMLQMPKRLRRDWFERYLRDPQAYRPGTRMPASFPDGKSVFAKIAEGRPADQIEALWQFLLLDKQAKPPAGLLPDLIELKDPERPVIYRNFFTNASPRGIAVGYPEALNLIWDAQQMKLVSVWKNSFIDASKHWTGRGVGAQEPLGDAIINADKMTSVAVLADASAAWPAELASGERYRFLGYRLDHVGRPTFRYRTANVLVEEKFEPTVSAVVGKYNLARRWKLSGTGKVTVLLASGNIQPAGESGYRIDDQLTLRIEGAEAELVSFSDHQELRMTKDLSETGAVEVVATMQW